MGIIYDALVKIRDDGPKCRFVGICCNLADNLGGGAGDRAGDDWLTEQFIAMGLDTCCPVKDPTGNLSNADMYWANEGMWPEDGYVSPYAQERMSLLHALINRAGDQQV
jgi:hypothetical protein